MKTLAELKRRLKKGIKVVKLKGMTDKGIGVVREINKVQTNGIYLNNSWLEFPLKSGLCEYTDNTFSFYMSADGHEYIKGVFRPKSDVKGELIGTYEIVE